MYTTVNFLKERNRMQELILIRDKKIAQVTSIILGVFLFITVALLAFQLYLSARLGGIRDSIAVEQRKVQSLSTLQTSYVTLNKKVRTVSEIVSKRGSKWDAIAFFYGILPQGVNINSVDLESDASGNQLSFSLEAPSVFFYDQLSSVLQSQQVKGSGYALTLGALSRSRDGKYRIEVTLKSTTAAAPKATPAPRSVPTQ